MSTITQENVVQSDAVADGSQSGENTTLRLIPAGEKFVPKTTFNGGKKVTCVYSFRPHENGPRYEKTTVFDFSHVSEEQLLTLALSSAKITVQALLRSSTPQKMVDPETLSTVDVLKQVIEASPRRDGNPVTVAEKALSRMDPDARAAFLKRYAEDTEKPEGDVAE